MTVPKKNRRLVYQRDDYRCVSCGTTEGLTIQHRINRGMGGSRSGALDRVENLLVLCGIENQRLESDHGFAREGLYRGYKLRSWENPLEVPVRYPDGDFYLTGRGTRIKTKETS